MKKSKWSLKIYLHLERMAWCSVHSAVYWLLTKGENRWCMVTNFYSGNKAQVIVCLLNRENCWGISWNCGMKCAVIHAHASWLWRREWGGKLIHEKVKLFSQCRCCTGTNIPCLIVCLLAACFPQWQAESSRSSLFLGTALPPALENPFAVGSSTQEVQVSCFHGASESIPGSQKGFLEFRWSLSCAVSYESPRKGFHMTEKKRWVWFNIQEKTLELTTKNIYIKKTTKRANNHYQ